MPCTLVYVHAVNSTLFSFRWSYNDKLNCLHSSSRGAGPGCVMSIMVSGLIGRQNEVFVKEKRLVLVTD